MTQISEIHGPIPTNELPDRGRMVRGTAPYIPYTSLTKGEMKLALLQEQASIYAAAFPENKQYRQAANMLDKALRAGVSNGVSFVGALHDPLLQQVALEITRAAKQTAPAARGGLLGRASLATGIQGIGEFKFDFDHDCVQFATKATNKKYGFNNDWKKYEHALNDSEHRRYYREQKEVCKIKIEIEKAVNSRITDASHHVLYYGLNEAYPGIKGSTVETKHLFHVGGIGGLANATETDASLMSTWSETSILRRNADGGVGPVGSIQSSFNLSPNYDAYAASYAKWQKTRTYSNPNGGKIGEPLTAIAVTKLVLAISSAIAAAAGLLKELNSRKAGAMSAAQAYGTPAFEAKSTDFNTPAGAGAGSDSNLLTFGLLGAAAYFLLSDEK